MTIAAKIAAMTTAATVQLMTAFSTGFEAASVDPPSFPVRSSANDAGSLPLILDAALDRRFGTSSSTEGALDRQRWAYPRKPPWSRRW